MAEVLRPAPDRDRRGRGAMLLLAGGFIVAFSVTVMFLGMRTVLDVGGFCASGGPYEIATPCPDAAAPSLMVGIFGWFAGAGLLAVGSAMVGGAWPITPVLAWSGLFGALGWNFLEYAFAGGSVEAGWLVCGLVFEAMAIVPLVVVIPEAARVGRGAAHGRDDMLRRARLAAGLRPPGAGSPTRTGGIADATPLSGRTFEPAAVVGGTLALPDPAHAWGGEEDAGAPSTAGETAGAPGHAPDIVSALERLAALHDAGQLSDREYALAKEAVLDAGSGSPP